MTFNQKTRIDDLSNVSHLYINRWNNNDSHLMTNKGITFIDATPVKRVSVVVASFTFDGVFDQIKLSTGIDGIKYSLKGSLIAAFDAIPDNDVYDENHLITLRDYISITSTTNDIYVVKKLSATELTEDQGRAVKSLFSVDTPLTNLVILTPLSMVFNPDTSKIKIHSYPKDIKSISSISIHSNSMTLLLAKAFAKGDLSIENNIDIDFEQSSPNHILIPFPASVASTQQKLIMYFRWLDINLTFLWNKASQFAVKAGGNSLYDGLFKLDGNTPLENSSPFIQYLYKTLVAMLILNNAYDAGYADFPRNDKTGKVVETAKIFETLLQSKEGLTVQQIAADMCRNIINKYPYDSAIEDSYKIFKQAVSALSFYIKSDLFSVARGGNKFNEIYLPYFLNLRTPAIYKTDDKGVVNNESLINNLKADLSSQYFDLYLDAIDKTTPRLKPKIKWNSLSFYQTVNIDQLVSFAEIPEELVSENIITDVSSLDVSKNDITKYMFYFPVEKGKTDPYEKVSNVFTADIITSQNNSQKTFNIDNGITNILDLTVSVTSSMVRPTTIVRFLPSNNNLANALNLPSFTYQSGADKSTDPKNMKDYIDKFQPLQKITKQMIYDLYIAPNLPQGATINKINGDMDISFTAVPYLNNKLFNPDNIPSAGSASLVLQVRITGTYVLNFSNLQKTFSFPEPLHDKLTFKNVVSRTSNSSSFDVDLNLNSSFVAQGTTIKALNTLTLVSIWGNYIDLIINYKSSTDGSDKSFVINDIELFNVNNEANTLNVLNLNIKTNN